MLGSMMGDWGSPFVFREPAFFRVATIAFLPIGPLSRPDVHERPTVTDRLGTQNAAAAAWRAEC
jgi:hypothetical protein